MNFPDVVGMSIDEGRQLVFDANKDMTIVIRECHSFKDKVLFPLSQARILKQVVRETEIHLYVGFIETAEA
ncbi:MAG: hypothetical protein JXO44_05725 [Clostridia bacterium]|nr:hypothetical protein [Clostridia bacterium]